MKKLLVQIYLFFHKIIIKLAWHIFTHCRLNQNKIVFSNFNGGGYGDNPKFIAQEILDAKLPYELFWVCGEKNSIFPSEIKLVKPNTLAFVYHMATAGFWIDNTRKLYYFKKRPEQYYIQTWHGGPGLKKVERDCEAALSEEYKAYAKIDSKHIDLFLSCCRWCSDLYHSSFWYSGALLEKGIPKNDLYFKNPEPIREKVFSHYKLDRSKKLVMYAPTYRDNRKTDMYNLDCEGVLKAFEKRFSGSFALLIRLHPNVAEQDGIFTYTDTILNASRYPNMQELLVASDMIITDYSGCAFDFPPLKKPGFLYAEDYEEMKQVKDYYFSLEELPFSLSRNNKELIQNIEQFQYKQYESDCERYVNEIQYFDEGNASRAVVEVITERIKKRNGGL
ncbi:CDP-glycerol glycerophosphotransferase family protein [Konateibacter massiliensis]|uniref:CDP-glycerol glycerophosphotransferase family protein n=1 Tax=Konateibacter massiliensis TaxID=2002841 RepID=UPI000C14CCDD|nr:CDP-glycerol glycerophosphotransferase family protein [Konateibacter massiliensis]